MSDNERSGGRDAMPTAMPWMPGDPPPQERVRQMVRVDHAGEYGARRIYEGQLAVLATRNSPALPLVREMARQEERHLRAFEEEIVARQVRPTALMPLWHIAGYALGATTALMGDKAAMACTIAIETVIDRHYAEQMGQLGEDETELRDRIAEFRTDELGHRDTGIEHKGLETPGYGLLAVGIALGSRAAIWLSKRI